MKEAEVNHKQTLASEFFVMTLPLSDEGISVEGRCHKGPIPVGHTFTVVSEMSVEVANDAYGQTTLTPLAAVRLMVKCMWAYVI